MSATVDHRRQPSGGESASNANHLNEEEYDVNDDLDNFMDDFDTMVETKQSGATTSAALTDSADKSPSPSQSAGPQEEASMTKKESASVVSGAPSEQSTNDHQSPLQSRKQSEHRLSPRSDLRSPLIPSGFADNGNTPPMSGRLKRKSSVSFKHALNTSDKSDTLTSQGDDGLTNDTPQAVVKRESLPFALGGSGALNKSRDSVISTGFDDSFDDSQVLDGDAATQNGSRYKLGRSSTYGESATDEEYAIDWCTMERTVYCSSRCHCFVQVLAMHQQVDCNVNAVSAAKYLENLCAACKDLTAQALIRVRKFLRCVTFIQLKYHWRFEYRKIRMQKNQFLGGCPRSAYESSCHTTKGRCIRCEPFLEVMRRELIAGLKEINADVPVPGSDPDGRRSSNAVGAIALAKLRVRRKGQATMESRKKLIERALRLSYFCCARCKALSKTMMKLAASGKLK